MEKKNSQDRVWVASTVALCEIKTHIEYSEILRPFITTSDDLKTWLMEQPDSESVLSVGKIKKLRSAEKKIISALFRVYERELGIEKSMFLDLLQLEIRRTVNYACAFLDNIEKTSKGAKIASFDCYNELEINSFDQFRDIFNFKNIGQELICEIWQSLNKNSNSISLGPLPPITNLSKKPNKRKNPKSLFKTLLHRLMKIICFLRTPKVVAIGTYWDSKALIKLYFSTSFRLRHFNNMKLSIENPKKINISLREYIREQASEGDELLHRMTIELIAKYWPTEAIENLQPRLQKAKNIIDSNFPKVKYWCFENWISNFDASTIKAVLNQCSDKSTINFEHNYTASHFLGNSNDIILNSSRYANTLGVIDGTKYLMAGSLFNFKNKVSVKKLVKNKNNYLLVLGAATPQTAEINGSNGDSGRLNSVKSLIEVNQLLEKIPNKIKNKIKVKAYPKSLIENFGGYNTIDYICGLEKKYKDYIDTNISAKNLMKTSELVIINYVSTTHLESLHSNIPTLLYWPSHRFKIDKNFAVNLEGLVRAKIIHFSINSLVNHLIQIDSDVLAWWCRPEVQIERLNFLKLNCDDGSSVFEFFATLTDNRD